MNRLALAPVLLALSLSMPTAVYAQKEVLPFANDGRSFITVSGTGQVDKAPDVASFAAGVITTGATAGEALVENFKKMRDVFVALEKLGIAEKDVQTSNVGI